VVGLRFVRAGDARELRDKPNAPRKHPWQSVHPHTPCPDAFSHVNGRKVPERPAFLFPVPVGSWFEAVLNTGHDNLFCSVRRAGPLGRDRGEGPRNPVGFIRGTDLVDHGKCGRGAAGGSYVSRTSFADAGCATPFGLGEGVEVRGVKGVKATLRC